MNNWLKNNQLLNINRLTSPLTQQSCVLCQASASQSIAFCQACLSSLPSLDHPYCRVCAAQTHGEICGSCLNSHPYYDSTQALLAYQYPIDSIIQHYKYQDALYLSESFGRLMADSLDFMGVDLIIPMPLHPNRMVTRGFNQSLEIAKVIAKHHQLVMDSQHCEKVKDTPPQASLAYKDRIKNMKNAFTCNTQYQDLHIGIIDDVMTTGTSLNELAKTLKKAGGSKISCYVLARTA